MAKHKAVIIGTRVSASKTDSIIIAKKIQSSKILINIVFSSFLFIWKDSVPCALFCFTKQAGHKLKNCIAAKAAQF